MRLASCRGLYSKQSKPVTLSGRILKAEFDSEGYYEIKVQDGQSRHLLHARPKGKIFKDELD